MNLRVAVTGVDGFIGSYVAAALRECGHVLVPVSRRLGHDVTDFASLASLPTFDVMVHLAAATSVPESYAHPHRFYHVNVTGTLNVLERTRVASARLVFLSSYVYGQPQYQPIDEAHPVSAFNPYAQTKLVGETLCSAFTRDFRLKTTIIRPFNVFGVGQAAHFLVPKIVQQVLRGDEVSLSDLRPRRDYVHARDLARAVVRAAEVERDDGPIFNIGGGISHAPADVIALVARLSGRSPKVVSTNQQRPNEILDTICDAGRARAELTWRPEVTLEQGLREMIADAKR